MSRFNNKTRGFTLVELSIVIIIIGFLIAGISAGQSLIKQAKLNTVITEFNEYSTAFNTFKIRFGYLPGDFPNAFALWGTNCSATAAHCNGDGDGIINQVAFNIGHPEQDVRQESFMAWTHLGLSGIIPGNYSGFGIAGNNWEAKIGVNIPASKYANGGWFPSLTDAWWYTVVDPILTARQALMVGAESPLNWTGHALFSPVDSSNIDSKIDDGMPYAGKVFTLLGEGASANCLTGSGSTAVYDFTANGPQCWMWFTYSDDK
jgi:prepilin-type N-terminal cleavage/methylation domain-containing protein